ncbi:hypothetical protein RRG08_064676 [Elysia crispata]|uniref:EGF-like domain-containing protein n=1 Tax=Elysia crispata TaxID=231223 RepID=A0AAE1CXG0_9GAST|nr:hypothetical protein RRG08_064676 [Elysia crispata]
MTVYAKYEEMLDKVCHHVNGTCTHGCDAGFYGPLCNDTLPRSKLSIGLGHNNKTAITLVVVVSVVTVVAAIVIGVYMWRRRRNPQELRGRRVVTYNQMNNDTESILERQDTPMD